MLYVGFKMLDVAVAMIPIDLQNNIGFTKFEIATTMISIDFTILRVNNVGFISFHDLWCFYSTIVQYSIIKVLPQNYK